MTIKCSTFLDVVSVVHFVLWSRLFPNCSLGAVPHLTAASVLCLLVAGGDLPVLCLNSGDLTQCLMSVCAVWCSTLRCHGWSAPVLHPRCHLCSGPMVLCLFPRKGPSESYWPYREVKIQSVFSLLPSLGEQTDTITVLDAEGVTFVTIN